MNIAQASARRARVLLTALLFLIFVQTWNASASAKVQPATNAVVLVHGWKGLGSCKGNYSFTPGVDETAPDGYFHGLATAIQTARPDTHPYKVFFARLETDPCNTPHIEDNVPNLKRAIDYAKQKTRSDKVILLAHSMGGLVSRAYIENPYIYQGDVAELYTFGTPHLGLDPNSGLSNFLVSQGLLQPDAESKSQPFLCDAGSAYSAILINKHQKPADVVYRLVSGSAPASNLSIVGKLVNSVYKDVPNDGFIPTTSGLGLPGRMTRLTTEEVHTTLLGPRDYFTPGTKSYECIMGGLGLTDEGAGACGTESELPPPPVTVASAYTCGNSIIFPETGYMVYGDFLTIWQGKALSSTGAGGMHIRSFEGTQAMQPGRSFQSSLYINGYPITGRQQEVSPTDGNIYMTQWFERARFEQHPENRAPNTVLLGLLGSSIAQTRGGEEPFRAITNPGGEIAWFTQTGHTLGDTSEGGKAIASNWNRLGGLAQFGYPLSQPFMETSKDDGKTYMVQYFERQRFEYHPEKKDTQFEILLGRLGAEQVRKPGVPGKVDSRAR